MTDIHDGNLTAEMLGVDEASSYEDAIAKGDTAFRRGETDKSAAYFVRAIEIASEELSNDKKQQADPDKMSEAGTRLASLYRQQGMQSQAERVYLMILQVNSSHVGSLEAMGLMRLHQRQIEQAKNYLEKALISWQSDDTENDAYTPINTLNGLAIMADLEENYVASAEYYLMALEHSVNNWRLMNNLGYSLYLSGDWNRAEYWYGKALNLMPDYHQALKNLALLKTRKKKYSEAIKLLEQIMFPWEAVHDVAFLAMLAGDLTSAESMFEQAIELSPTFYVEAWSNLQQVRMRI